MNILNTMDYIHHLRTWRIPQAMRRMGILSEGWNPKRDRYEHKFFGIVYSFEHFYTVAKTHPYANMEKVDPLPFPKGPYLKEKSSRLGKTGQGFEVTLPHGYVRVYPSLDALKKELTSMRTNTSRFHAIKKGVEKGKVNGEMAARLLKKRTGLPLSQLGCDPASLIVIKNLKTGAFITRNPLNFSTSEGMKAAMAEEFSLPLPPQLAKAVPVIAHATLH